MKKIISAIKNMDVKVRTAIILMVVVLPAILMASMQLHSPIFMSIIVISVIAIGLVEVINTIGLNYTTKIVVVSVVVFGYFTPFSTFSALASLKDETSLYAYMRFMFIEQFTSNFLSYIILGVGWLFSLSDSSVRKSRKPFKLFLIIGFLIFSGYFGGRLMLFTIVAEVWTFLGIVLISVFADTFASVFGKAFGKKFIKRGLSPKISPNKSWEGGIGAVVSTAAMIMLFGLIPGAPDIFWINTTIDWLATKYYLPEYVKVLMIIIYAIIMPIIAILGDLMFSLVKRISYVKDFSTLIPGHGGVFDRIDSHIVIFASINILSLIFIMIVG